MNFGNNKFTILLIGNDDRNMQLINHFLAEESIDIIHAESISAGCNFFRSNLHFDFILLDKEMYNSANKFDECFIELTTETPMLLISDKKSNNTEHFIRTKFGILDVIAREDLSKANLKHKIKNCQIHHEFTQALKSLYSELVCIKKEITSNTDETKKINKEFFNISKEINELAKRIANDQIYFFNMHEAYLIQFSEMKEMLTAMKPGV